MSTGPSPSRKNNTAEIVEQQKKCYDLRLSGHSIRAIAEKLDIPRATVQRRLDAECEAQVTPGAEAVRKMELDRLDKWMLALENRILDGDHQAITTAIKVAERRAKYLGLDAPTQIDATVTETTQEDLALAELIREARMRQATIEDAIKEATTKQAA